MSDRKELQAFWALRRAVANNGGDPDDDVVVGGEVMISWDAESAKFDVWTADGAQIAAPTLVQALLAIEYVGEGEGVCVDAAGRAVCRSCGGQGCSECDGHGLDLNPPREWPGEGVVI